MSPAGVPSGNEAMSFVLTTCKALKIWSFAFVHCESRAVILLIMSICQGCSQILQASILDECTDPMSTTSKMEASEPFVTSA